MEKNEIRNKNWSQKQIRKELKFKNKTGRIKTTRYDSKIGLNILVITTMFLN